MKHVLIVSGIQIFPPQSGGNLRTAALAESLAHLGYGVTIYSFTGRKEDYKKFARSSASSPSVGIVEQVNRAPWYGLLQWLTYRRQWPDLWHLLPLPLPRLLRQEIAASDFVIVDFPFLYRYLKRARSGGRIFNSHNLEHERWGGLLASLVEYAQTRAAQVADLVLVTTKEEANFYCESYSTRIALVQNGILPERLERYSPTRQVVRESLGVLPDWKVVLFAASQYGPNREAYDRLLAFERENKEWLLENKILLLVAGSVTNQPIRGKTLYATGPVSSIESYFAAADYAINPISSGSGTNIKMAEYIVSRLATLTTSFGRRGLKLEPGEDCLELDLENFKQGLSALCELDSASAAKMADRAYQKNRHLVDMNVIVRDTLVPLLSQ